MPATRTSERAGPLRNESLRRGLLVLRAVVRAAAPITAAQVARETGLAGATVARLLATLADEGMAVRSATGGWRPGPGVSELAGAEGRVVAMVLRAGEVLRGLAEQTGESALLTRVRLPDAVEVLVQEDADQLLGVTRWVGRVFDPHRSVSGWAVGATLEPEVVAALGGEDAEAHEGWLAGVAGARARGYALDVDGLERGLTSLAVSVPSSVPSMTVGMAGPSLRLTADRVAAVVPQLHAAARILAESHSVT